MKSLSKFRILSLITLFFFLCSTLTPPDAQAFHASCWHCSGGQGPLGGPVTTQGGPANPEKPAEPPEGQLQPGNCTGDPVYTHTGEFFYECPDLFLPGRGMDLEIKHLYRSGRKFNNQFGYGWFINTYYRLHTLTNGNALIVSGEGRKDEFVYDAPSGVYAAPGGIFATLVQNPDGTWTLTQAQGEQYNFDLNGVLSSIVDRSGNPLTFIYEAQALPIIGVSIFSLNPDVPGVVAYDYRLKRIIDTVGRNIDFQYNATGRLISIIDPAGRTVTYAYDTHDNLATITKPATAQYPGGLTRTFTYDSSHNLLTITDSKGQRFVTNQYDSQERVTQQTLGSGMYAFTYGVNTTTVTDRKGTVTKYTFNAAGNPLTTEVFTRGLRSGDPPSFITIKTYDSFSNLLTVQYPKGNGVKFTYDSANTNVRSRGNLLSVRRKANMAAADNDTNDLVTRLTYEPQFNFPKTVTDPKGSVTTYTYDYELPPGDARYATQGNLVTVRMPTVAGQTPEINLTYNAFGQPIQVVDQNANITQYDYFAAAGYVKEVIRDPSGINARTQITYDAFGNIDTLTDANAHTTDYNFNELGWLVETIDRLGHKTRLSYDENGNVTRVERQADEAGTTWQTVELSYDVLNNLKTLKDPLGRITTYNYDANENLASIQDANGNTTAYEYDERDLLFRMTDANAPPGVTQYDYDGNGNLKQITDANANPTAYAFDGFDRLITMTYADSTSEQYAYDKNSNLTRRTTPSARPIDYVYDALNRLNASRFTSDASLDKTFTYDLGSRLLSANTSASQNSFTYDALNRVISTTQTLSSVPFALSYEYDKEGNRTKAVYPSGKVVEYAYDSADRLSAIKVNGALLANYAYDPLDRRVQKDLLSGVTQRATYQYDLANQLLNLNNAIMGGPTISQYSYTYDSMGNKLTMAAPNGVHNYSYNPIYELTGVSGAQTHSFSYDKVGNRQNADGVSYTANSLNQYTNVDGTGLSYDLNGNLTFDGANTYTYDEENRLSSAVNADNATTYAYDAFNRRVSKALNGLTAYFVYDEDEDIEERDASGALQAEYVTGDRIDEVLTMTRGSNTYYYHYDGLGSVTEITGSSGAVVESYAYDVYGQPSVPASSIGNRYRFTGRELDEETGLYHYRARAYDPKLGRFLQRDPIAYYDSMNLFQYANNNPVNFIDPYGEFVTIAIGGIVIGEEIVRWGLIGLGGLIAYTSGQMGRDGGSCPFPIRLGSPSMPQTRPSPVLNAEDSTSNAEGQQNSQSDDFDINNPQYPGDDPNKSPGKDWEWRGRGSPESGQGNWYNPKTGESLNPDLKHPLLKKPHWGYSGPKGDADIFSDGTIQWK